MVTDSWVSQKGKVFQKGDVSQKGKILPKFHINFCMTNLNVQKLKVGQNYCSSRNYCSSPFHAGLGSKHLFQTRTIRSEQLLHDGGIQLTYHFTNDVSLKTLSPINNPSKYCRMSRCCTARGSLTEFSLVGPAKVRAH